MAKKPEATNSFAQNELDKAEKQLDQFESHVQSLTMDRMNQLAPKQETEGPKIAQKELEKKNDKYLKPFKTIGCRDKFNEDYRSQYEYDKEYVKFMAQNNEIIGEAIEIWTRPYGGMPAEFWKVPVNTPVWGPRYLAEQIKRKFYHRMKMEDKAPNLNEQSSENMQYYGAMAVDSSIQRLDAHPVSDRKSIFMGASGF